MEYFVHLGADSVDAIKQACGTEVEELNVTENGTYNAPSGKAYNPVIVNVESGGIEAVTVKIHVTNPEAYQAEGYYVSPSAVIINDEPPVIAEAGTVYPLDSELSTAPGIYGNYSSTLWFAGVSEFSNAIDMINPGEDYEPEYYVITGPNPEITVTLSSK